jgi:hypothetical protein
VHVVGHEHISMNRAAVTRGCRREPIAVAGVILFAKEDGLAIIAALDHVQRLIRQEVTSEPRHSVLSNDP